jgi:hypothetical protein
MPRNSAFFPPITEIRQIGSGFFVISHDLRQAGAPRPAPVADITLDPARAVGRDLVLPVDQLGVTPALLDQSTHGVAAPAPALRALDREHVELTSHELTQINALKKPPMRNWPASLIRKRTEFLGHVEAPDREAAEAAAAERFKLTEEQRRRLVLQEQVPSPRRRGHE